MVSASLPALTSLHDGLWPGSVNQSTLPPLKLILAPVFITAIEIRLEKVDTLVSLTGFVLPYLSLLWSRKWCLLSHHIPLPSNPAGRPHVKSLSHVSGTSQNCSEREGGTATALFQPPFPSFPPSCHPVFIKIAFFQKDNWDLFSFLYIRKQAVENSVWWDGKKRQGLRRQVLLHHVSDNQVSGPPWETSPSLVLSQDICPRCRKVIWISPWAE